MQETLLEQTYQLLDDSNESLNQIALGADVGNKWLGRVSRRELDDPGVTKIERVFKYLKKRRGR